MADYTTTGPHTLIAHQAVTHPDTLGGADVNARDGTIPGGAGKLGAYIYMYHALVEAIANTNPGSFFVQVTHEATADDAWVTVAEFRTSAGTPSFEDLTATEPSGETVLAVASTTGFVAGDLLYVQDTGTIADSEWHRCEQIVADTSVTLVDGLQNGKDSADDLWDLAERFSMWLDLAGIRRYRVIYQHEGATGANVHVKADAIEVTAFV